MINEELLLKFSLQFPKRNTLWFDYLETLGEAIKKEFYSSISLKYKVLAMNTKDEYILSFSVLKNNNWSDYKEFCSIVWSEELGTGWRFEWQNYCLGWFLSEEDLQSIIISKIIMNPELENLIKNVILNIPSEWR